MAGKRKSVNGSTPASVGVEPLVRELDAIKRLLVLLLAKSGADSTEIAMALEVEASTVRHMISFRKVRKIGGGREPQK